jgi:8-oxo-dGTP pyrophosphatase MutT (NUDIX family)
MPDLGREVKEELGLDKRSEVPTHVRRYRDNRDEVEVLADHGTEI